ncbi:Nucleoside-diphosphate-sugar epimerase [Hydrocarboniphaga daqingensis]|uniref:Nucleoside-diphosphate-sugar epimerase n=2 Tax=Hydrocarboniphaga daqingensis TaxID=490188 RepID=A0A1M5PS51_9GAMM|nr:Nucleoside-diphosphate-sugar epimerase [Hydrocarboniphaga daqingensis]
MKPMTHTSTTIAITGIGGFIGLRMAERARANGWTVRGLDLSPAGAERARAAGAEVVVGSVNDAAAVAAALQGADWVFHTAAIVEEDGPRDLYERVNIEGTRTVCKVAQQLGVRRLVHLSSVMVYGFDYPQDVAEDGPVDGQGNVYNDTKLASERVALSFNDPQRLGVIVIRPGDVYGRGSLPWVTRPVQMLRRGVFMLPGRGSGVINHVHVDNLIDGVMLAVDHDAIGEAFNITDGVATRCDAFFAPHARLAGVRRVPALPTWAVMLLMRLSQPWWRLRGQTPPASPTALRFLLRRHRYSIAKAQARLGYQPRIDLEQGVQQMLSGPPIV